MARKLFCIQSNIPEKVGEYLSERYHVAQKAKAHGNLLVFAAPESCRELVETLRKDTLVGRQVNRTYIVDRPFKTPGEALAYISSKAADGGVYRVQANRIELEDTLLDELYTRGVRLSPTAFDSVVNVVHIDGKYWCGIVGADLYFAMRNDINGHVSKAYYKIAEAVERFKIPINENWSVVDVGAAPGGWAEALSGRVGRYVAVDPADMEISAGNITHIRGMMGESDAELSRLGPFDLMLADINRRPYKVADMLVENAGLLRHGGYLVMTLKFTTASKKGRAVLTDRTLDALKDEFKVMGIKSLMGNTDKEATLFAQRG